MDTAWKVSKCGVFSGPYFPAFGLNTEIFDFSNKFLIITWYKKNVDENSWKSHFHKENFLEYFWGIFKFMLVSTVKYCHQTLLLIFSEFKQIN